METTRIFYVNTKQTFAGSSIWSEELLRQKLGDGKWEVYWTNYTDVHPEIPLHRPEGAMSPDEIFSLINHYRDNTGVLHLHQGADDSSVFAFDSDYWISPTQLCVSSATTRGVDKSGYLFSLVDRAEKFHCGQLYRTMRLSEIFELNFFEELVCEPYVSGREKFFIHKEDIVEPDGKFYQFNQYTIDKFTEEFNVMVKCH